MAYALFLYLLTLRSYRVLYIHLLVHVHTTYMYIVTVFVILIYKYTVHTVQYIHLGVGRCVLLVHRKLCEVMAVSAVAPAVCSSLSSATVISAMEENGAPHS